MSPRLLILNRVCLIRWNVVYVEAQPLLAWKAIFELLCIADRRYQCTGREMTNTWHLSQLRLAEFSLCQQDLLFQFIHLFGEF